MENVESPSTNPYRRNRLDRQKDEYESLSEERKEAGSSSLGTKNSGAQGWRNVRAVMAYYCTLRKIKRNGGVHVIYIQQNFILLFFVIGAIYTFVFYVFKSLFECSVLCSILIS